MVGTAGWGKTLGGGGAAILEGAIAGVAAGLVILLFQRRLDTRASTRRRRLDFLASAMRACTGALGNLDYIDERRPQKLVAAWRAVQGQRSDLEHGMTQLGLDGWRSSTDIDAAYSALLEASLELDDLLANDEEVMKGEDDWWSLALNLTRDARNAFSALELALGQEVIRLRYE